MYNRRVDAFAGWGLGFGVWICTVVDRGDRLHTRVLRRRRDFCPALLGLVPVQDPADEWRDERDIGLGARDGLRHAEKKGKVAVDAWTVEDPVGTAPETTARTLEQISTREEHPAEGCWQYAPRVGGRMAEGRNQLARRRGEGVEVLKGIVVVIER